MPLHPPPSLPPPPPTSSLPAASPTLFCSPVHHPGEILTFLSQPELASGELFLDTPPPPPHRSKKALLDMFDDEVVPATPDSELALLARMKAPSVSWVATPPPSPPSPTPHPPSPAPPAPVGLPNLLHRVQDLQPSPSIVPQAPHWADLIDLYPGSPLLTPRFDRPLPVDVEVVPPTSPPLPGFGRCLPSVVVVPPTPPSGLRNLMPSYTDVVR